jgi:hypothetical protein
VGTGVYSSVASACKQIIKKEDICHPDIKCFESYFPYYELYKDLYSVLKDRFNILSKI